MISSPTVVLTFAGSDPFTRTLRQFQQEKIDQHRSTCYQHRGVSTQTSGTLLAASPRNLGLLPVIIAEFGPPLKNYDPARLLERGFQASGPR